jgi:hypothetical protein
MYGSAEIGNTMLSGVEIVAFMIVMLTNVPDWIAPKGTNGAGNSPDPRVGRTVKMIK